MVRTNCRFCKVIGAKRCFQVPVTVIDVRAETIFNDSHLVWCVIFIYFDRDAVWNTLYNRLVGLLNIVIHYRRKDTIIQNFNWHQMVIEHLIECIDTIAIKKYILTIQIWIIKDAVFLYKTQSVWTRTDIWRCWQYLLKKVDFKTRYSKRG